jgi:hypothetical protein
MEAVSNRRMSAYHYCILDLLVVCYPGCPWHLDIIACPMRPFALVPRRKSRAFQQLATLSSSFLKKLPRNSLSRLDPAKRRLPKRCYSRATVLSSIRFQQKASALC